MPRQRPSPRPARLVAIVVAALILGGVVGLSRAEPSASPAGASGPPGGPEGASGTVGLGLATDAGLPASGPSEARGGPGEARGGPDEARGGPDAPAGHAGVPPGLRAEIVAGLLAGLREAARPPEAGTGAGPLEPGSLDRTSLDLEATYTVRATLGWASRRLAVETKIAVTNRSGGPIDHLLLNTVAGPLGRLGALAAEVGGRPVRVTRSDQTIRIPLGGVLPDGGSAEVVVRYRATIRSDLGGPSGSAWLFTRTNGILALYRWIPWLSREHPFARPNHGDPFVTAVSPKVRLEVVADRALRYAINARRIATSDGGRRVVFLAEQVRDVVLTAAPDYRTLRGRVGETEIEVVARPGAPAAALLAEARLALGRLERLLGPYPYERLVVAESAGGYALEGPGIIWIPRGVATSRLPYLVTHEIGHQWFYGLVGNDQAADPFADEAVTDMVSRYVLRIRRGPRCAAGRLDRPIYAYSAACYYERIYVAGGNLLDDLRRQMGTGAFFRALRAYLDEHRFRLAGSADLVAALDAATPLDVRAFVGRLLPSLRAADP